MGPNVFLSYSSADYGVAQEVRRALEAGNMSVVDIRSLSAGDAWVREIDEALKSVDVVIAVISNDYASSAYTTSEWSAALAGGKRVVPVLVEHDARVPALLAPYVGIDVSDPSTRSDKLKLLVRQIHAKSQSASDSSIDGLRSMEKHLTESRIQRAALSELLDLTRQQQIARFRWLAIALVGLFIAATGVVVIFLTVSDSQIGLSALAAALTGTIGILIGRLSKLVGTSSRSKKGPESRDTGPDSSTTSGRGVRQ